MTFKNIKSSYQTFEGSVYTLIDTHVRTKTKLLRNYFSRIGVKRKKKSITVAVGFEPIQFSLIHLMTEVGKEMAVNTSPAYKKTTCSVEYM